MPILVSAITGAGSAGQPPELTTVTWTSATGAVTILSDWPSGWLVQPGIRGLDMPVWQAYEDESPSIDGNFRRGTRAKAREIMIPLVIFADEGRTAFMARKRALLAAMNPQAGMGTLTLTEPDGSLRRISAYYSAGAEGTQDVDTSGRRWVSYGLTFTCPSPFWLGADVGRTFRVSAGGSFFPSGVPWNVADSQVIGSHVAITNPGDVTAYPVWTIQGPATAAVFTNNLTGEVWTFTGTLLITDTLVVDCRERIKTVTLNGVTNLWPDLSVDSVLWALGDGLNDVSLTVSGSTAATVVSFALTPRYLAA